MTDTERPKNHIVNCETGEVTIVDLTDEEIAANEALAIEVAAVEAAREAQAQATVEAKASALAKLAALGLTEAEANALVK